MTCGLYNVGHIAGSPPCQPWSGAGYGSGLKAVDGAIFLKCLLWAAKGGILSFTAENVPGLPRHDDFGLITRNAEEAGMCLKLHGVYQVSSILPVQRDRWLGTFLHKTVESDVPRLKDASSVSFAQGHGNGVPVSPCIATRDVIHLHMSANERADLHVSDAAFQAMGDAKYAPKWLRDICSDLLPTTLVEGRVISWDGPFKSFMACYGSQHEIDPTLLATKGLHTMIFHDNEGIRMISPWEMVAAMAVSPKVVLPCNIKDAWRVAGNALSPVHALLQLVKTHVLLGEQSPFTCTGHFHDILDEVLNDSIHLSHFETMVDDGFWVLQLVENTTIKDVRGGEKKRKIDESVPPTVPFDVEDDDEVAMKYMKFAPTFHVFDDPRNVTGDAGNSYGGMVMLHHGNLHWVMFVNHGDNDTVQTIAQKGLPHARAEHFAQWLLNDVPIKWSDLVPGGTMQRLKFDPVPCIVQCQEQSLGIAMNLKIDVTWTVKATYAMVAAQIGCAPESIVIVNHDTVLREDDFILQYEPVDMKVKFKACLPGYVSWERKAANDKVVVTDPGVTPAGLNHSRWVARHPCKKVVRTIATDEMMQVQHVVASLFPDLHATVAWKVFCDEVQVDNHALVNAYQTLTVQWDSFRPLQVTFLRKLDLKASVDSPSVQNGAPRCVRRAVRSPFKVKPDELLHPIGTTIGEIAASYFATSLVETSMLCTAGSHLMDPETLVEFTSGAAVLSFRVCPLLGGAKHDGVRQRVKQMLGMKGVPDDKINDRVNGLFGKTSPDKLNDHMKDNDDDFWEAVKRAATDCKFRLIFPAELKLHQQKQRKMHPAKEQPKKMLKTKHIPKVDAHAVVVDPNHFAANGEAVGLIEVARFGSDMCGICPVTPTEARQCLSSAPKSIDALALLVIGEGASAMGPTVCVPVHTVDGNPSTVDACIIQCGDIEISPAINLPSVVVDQLPSTTIEFVIDREFVGNWLDTAVPLHFVGVHVAALRGSNLLSTWSIKSWKGSKQVHYTQASHWHGFFRISDALLEQVLSRSGMSGIFMSPKTALKKHDPRYVVIPVPNKQLPEVHAKIENCNEVIGIVKINDGFAVRCKREDASSVRAQLLPESAYVATASFDSNQALYMLRNVPQVGRDELSAALSKLGWNAIAVRPQGVNKWVIAASAEPPCQHLVINGSIATVDSMQRKSDKGLTIVAREYKVDTIRDNQNQVVAVSTTSRIAEMKAQVETQIAAAVDCKLAVANQRIEELSTALEAMKSEQAFTKQKIAEVESSVTSNSQAIIAKMGDMFKEMDTSFRQALQNMSSVDHDPEKRARVGDVPKHDPFASKS
eukprot:Skav223602  [mRNA]  locus=scaffold493:442399:446367:+ [translate_table: standard]